MRVVLFVLLAAVLVAAVVLPTLHEPEAVVLVHGSVRLPPSLSGDRTDPNTGPKLDGLGDPGIEINLLGDEVTAAVATYTVDAAGNLFEVHAPHTEVPRLSSPEA